MAVHAKQTIHISRLNIIWWKWSNGRKREAMLLVVTVVVYIFFFGLLSSTANSNDMVCKYDSRTLNLNTFNLYPKNVTAWVWLNVNSACISLTYATSLNVPQIMKSQFRLAKINEKKKTEMNTSKSTQWTRKIFSWLFLSDFLMISNRWRITMRQTQANAPAKTHAFRFILSLFETEFNNVFKTMCTGFISQQFYFNCYEIGVYEEFCHLEHLVTFHFNDFKTAFPIIIGETIYDI